MPEGAEAAAMDYRCDERSDGVTANGRPSVSAMEHEVGSSLRSRRTHEAKPPASDGCGARIVLAVGPEVVLAVGPEVGLAVVAEERLEMGSQ